MKREAVIYYDPVTNKWDVMGYNIVVWNDSMVICPPTGSLAKARRLAKKWISGNISRYVFERMS